MIVTCRFVSCWSAVVDVLMYEQSAMSLKKTDEELMNTPIAGQADKDMKELCTLNKGSVYRESVV